MCADKYRTALRLADYGLTQALTKLINGLKKQMNRLQRQVLSFSYYENIKR